MVATTTNEMSFLRGIFNTTILRGFIALVILGVTFLLTLGDTPMSAEWDAVFLVVIGYYFKDRPLEDSFLSGKKLDERYIGQEMLLQFILAMCLLVGTAGAFLFPHFKESIAGVWIGAVVLAVGFFFKESRVAALEPRHQQFRAAIALVVAALTIPIVFFSSVAEAGKSILLANLRIPLQWVGIVFIVVAFYFKERSTAGETGGTHPGDTLSGDQSGEPEAAKKE
ncbi:MAG: hypothetical protein ACFFCW_34785 [Candidatus Hodarchaeota archaeon]